MLFFLKPLFYFISLIARQQPDSPKVFEENPKNMSLADLIYFSYKYYCKNYNTGLEYNFLSIPEQGITLNKTQKPTLKINIGGDLMPYKFINSSQCDRFWEQKMDFWDADIVAANLETPIDINKQANVVPEMMLKDMLFNSSKEQFDVFDKGFNVLSVANNHTLDMGYDGLAHTLSFLQNKNILSCGAGLNDTTCIYEANGVKVGFLAFTYSLNQFDVDPTQPLKVNLLNLNDPKGCDITPIKKQAEELSTKGADYIIAMLHCGNAYQPFPGPQTQALFNKIAQETNVNCIVGGHAHNVQPFQLIENGQKKVLVAYSLGDFVAYDIYQRSHLNFYLELNLFKNENGVVDLHSFKVHSNYLQYKNKKLQLVPFKAYLQETTTAKSKDLEAFSNLVLNRGTNE